MLQFAAAPGSSNSESRLPLRRLCPPFGTRTVGQKLIAATVSGSPLFAPVSFFVRGARAAKLSGLSLSFAIAALVVGQNETARRSRH
ncbi:MAG: hypothetical protein V4726_05775 [Verrucomicrobiota bacterium]